MSEQPAYDPSKEGDAPASNRWRREGRLEEVAAWKDAKRRELRSSKAFRTRDEVNAEVWRLAKIEFPPLPKPEPEPEPEPPPVVDADAEDFDFGDAGDVDIQVAVQWVIDNFAVYDDLRTRGQDGRAREMLASSPSGAAAGYMQWVRDHGGRGKFFGDIVPKILGKADSQESRVFEDDRRKITRMLDEIERYLDEQGETA